MDAIVEAIACEIGIESQTDKSASSREATAQVFV